MPEQNNEGLVEVTDKISDSIWGETPRIAPKEDVNAEPQAEPISVIQPASVAEPQPDNKVADFDINKYFKDELNFDSVEVAKEQINKWKQLEAQPPKEPEPIKFGNEDSEKVFNLLKEGKVADALKIYQKQQEIENADKLPAIDAVRLLIKNKNEDYNADDINDIIEERYSYPKEPVQGADELDNEFQERMKNYEASVKKIDRRIERDAKEAVRELQQFKKDLVFPDINNGGADYQRFLKEQEELQTKNQQAIQNYKQVLDKDYSSFNGYETAYKDKDVNIPISYKPTEQEVKSLKEKFANDFDADEYFANRWIKTENDKVVGHNVKQQMADVYLLENQQKVFDRIASEAYTKAIDTFMKNEKNIKITDGGSGIIDKGLQNQRELDERVTKKLWGD
jgi:hypothetical protein